VTEYFDEVKDVKFSNLKLSTEKISLRLPQALLDQIRREAKRRDMPYQSLMKSTLYDVFFSPNKIMRRGKGFQGEMREFGL
jgi:predicted DNA binding CopG/RHH family protein